MQKQVQKWFKRVLTSTPSSGVGDGFLFVLPDVLFLLFLGAAVRPLPKGLTSSSFILASAVKECSTIGGKIKIKASITQLTYSARSSKGH